MAKIHCQYEGKESFFPITKERTLIGRPPGKGQSPDLALPENDYHAGRAHAFITQEHGCYWIEDSQSISGTWINGNNIQGKGRVEWLPNTSVKIGKSLLTLMADSPSQAQDTSSLLKEVPLRVAVSCPPEVAYSWVYNGDLFPIEVTVYNDGTQDLRDIQLEVALGRFGQSKLEVISRVEAGKNIALATPPLLQFDLQQLCEVTDIQQERLEVESPTHKLHGEIPLTVQILPADAWHREGNEATLAGFVAYHDQAVEAVIGRARTILRCLVRGAQSFEDIRRIHQNAALLILKTLYCTLQERYDIAYGLEPRCYGLHWQRVRFPQEVIEKLEGTCVDLTILFAACLENRHLNPVLFLIFMGIDPGSGQMIHHALAGCWTRPSRMKSPVERNAFEIWSWVEAGELLVLDAVGYSRGEGGDHLFSEAQLKGRKSLENACHEKQGHALLFAIDIQAARLAGYHPLQHGSGAVEYDQRVSQALTFAKDEAERARSDSLTARHLFLGLLRLDASLLHQIFECFEEGLSQHVTSAAQRSLHGVPTPPLPLPEDGHWQSILELAKTKVVPGIHVLTEHHLTEALLEVPSQVHNILMLIGQKRHLDLAQDTCLANLQRLGRDTDLPSIWRHSQFL